MSKDKKDQLRIDAEARIKSAAANASKTLSHVDIQHELEVHQIELEMQNEELRSIQQKLEDSLRNFEELFDFAPVGYLTLNRHGVIGSANLMTSRLLGIERSRLIGSKFNLYVDPKNMDEFYRLLRTVKTGTDQHSMDLSMRRGDGSNFIARLDSVFQLMGDNQETKFLIVLSDITDIRQQERLIYHQANYDPLTELPNRSLFMDRLDYSIRTASRENTSLALFFVDLDNFKIINDTYGHTVGDEVLKEVAKRLSDSARSNDTVARIGGDEFCVILPKMHNSISAGRLAAKMLEIMDKPIKGTSVKNLYVSCSIGIASYPQDGSDSESLMKSADLAMYQVKRSGRNHFAFFTGNKKEIMKKGELAADLHRAVEMQQLSLRFQPIIHLSTGKLFGVEVLIRWEHPDYGLLQPLDFIPVAETYGEIARVEKWVLENVAKQTSVWRSEGSQLETIWINLSVKQCSSPRWAEHLTELLENLEGWRLSSGKLGLEITESSELELSDANIQALHHLHDLGYRLSVDDFGTGYSSLEKLLHLPIDIIKIDKSFVSDIVESDKNSKLVHAVIALGHSMDALLVAEGIETQEQFDMLLSIGCDLGQGFHIAEPLTSEKLHEYIQKTQNTNPAIT